MASRKLKRKPAATGAPKTKGRRVQGGRVVESRYLQDKKTKKLLVLKLNIRLKHTRQALSPHTIEKSTSDPLESPHGAGS